MTSTSDDCDTTRLERKAREQVAHVQTEVGAQREVQRGDRSTAGVCVCVMYADFNAAQWRMSADCSAIRNKCCARIAHGRKQQPKQWLMIGGYGEAKHETSEYEATVGGGVG